LHPFYPVGLGSVTAASTNYPPTLLVKVESSTQKTGVFFFLIITA